ncbi:MAG: YqaE/Pmp3 family membrane protein [Actinomycetota bacterium]|nr:YqaE/Pmp3 family membrane protein [Actinomycetota bacterium]
MGLFRLILSILVPPLGVFLQAGLGWQFLLNVLLTALGYFPGLIHAVWRIFSKR